MDDSWFIEGAVDRRSGPLWEAQLIARKCDTAKEPDNYSLSTGARRRSLSPGGVLRMDSAHARLRVNPLEGLGAGFPPSLSLRSTGNRTSTVNSRVRKDARGRVQDSRQTKSMSRATVGRRHTPLLGGIFVFRARRIPFTQKLPSAAATRLPGRDILNSLPSRNAVRRNREVIEICSPSCCSLSSHSCG